VLKIFLVPIFVLLSLLAMGQDVESLPGEDDPLFQMANELLSQSNFEATLKELTIIENKVIKDPTLKANLGKVLYWKGIVANRLNEFPLAIKSFDRAFQEGFDSPDLHYELGQSLFAAEQLKRARAKFARSYKNNFKRAVSLYYIAYISRELREFKKAHKYYLLIEKLPKSESKEVLQAARMQLGDMYLSKAIDHPNSFRMIESLVIPQYEKALEVDQATSLGRSIKSKITDLQKKYDLLLFQLRNGRPVLRPPYFLKVSQEIGYDSNVTFNPNETTVDRAKQASEFTRTDIFGRYTFYYQDYYSLSPEIRFNNTYYFNREPEIYRNDNQIYSGALRNAYEYDLRGRPASLLFDIEYTEVLRDIRVKKKLQYNSSSFTYMLGQRMNFWDRGDTVFRLKYRTFDSYNEFSGSKTISASVEQVIGLDAGTLLLYGSIDRTRVDFDLFDTNSFTVRGDYIYSGLRDYVIPVVGVGVTRVDPTNDRSFRGIETLINPSVRLIKNFGRNWRVILKYDKQDYDSQDNALFAYKKELYGMELEYLF
jgi:hypothetical protein